MAAPRSRFAANVQLDGATYGESPAGPLTTDFRRGSVGGVPNRENTAARDFSDGFYFRRARFGVEGTIARDFNYRLLLELGGSGTEGPTRINDAWIAYTGFAPFTFQLGAFSPPANMDDGTSPEDLPFLERASASELSRSLGGADGRLGFAVKANGARWMSSLAFTTRTANDAEVFDAQAAAVGTLRLPAWPPAMTTTCTSAPRGPMCFRPPTRARAPHPRHPLRFRDRPEIRVDSVRLIDTGNIDADNANVYGLEFGANWKSLYLQGEHFWYDVARRAAEPARRSGFHRLLPAGQLDPHRREPALQRRRPARSRIRAPMVPFSGNGGFGALGIGGALQPHESQFRRGPGRHRGRSRQRARRRSAGRGRWA